MENVEHPFITEMRKITQATEETKRRTDAFALVSRMLDRISAGRDAYVSLAENVVTPRGAWRFLGQTRYAESCNKCGQIQPKGSEVWWRVGVYPRISMCVPCYEKGNVE